MSGYFTAILAVYLGATTAYSFFLKRVVVADVLTLAILYTIRIVAGAFAIRVLPTFWLLAFSMFIFFGLALMKRFTELHERFKAGGDYMPGRGYRASDLRLLGSLGASSSTASVLVLALYINSQDVTRHYPSPFLLWMLCPLLLYWLGRLWLHTERGQMHDDPVVFAVKDPYSRLTAGMSALVLVSAALLPTSIWPPI
jgi:4-hydroxybenzoate polyprenyltransferase